MAGRPVTQVDHFQAAMAEIAEHCAHLDDYGKLIDGPLAICELGLPKLRAVCPRLDRWLSGFER